MNARLPAPALVPVLLLSTFLATTPGAEAETYHLFADSEAAPAAPPEAGARLSGLAEAPRASAAQTPSRPTFGRLLREDLKQVFTSPARLRGRGWAATALAVGSLAAIMGSEKGDVDAEMPEGSSFERNLASTFEPLGAEGSFAVLGAFALAGAIGQDRHAEDVALDGAISSLIAGGLISPFLKESLGRHRPHDSASATDFQPFSGNASFPSGHTTQAFAIASVIATEYPRPWVEVASYGSAALVGYARVLHDRHYGSDVLAGALIGTLVGREVARHNELRRSEHVAVLPLVGPHRSAGLAVHLGFGGPPARGYLR
jgi:hypothetical protein